MTATIGVVGDPTHIPPRTVITVAGSPGTAVTVTRTDPDGAIRPVRSGESATLVAGGWVGFDYESPFDPSGTASVTYSAAPNDGSTPFLTTVDALNVNQAWLIHPGVPDLSMQVAGITFSDTSTDPGISALHEVLGRADPVPVTDGRRKTPSFTVTITTPDEDASGAMRAILRDTAPLLLQMAYTFTTVTSYDWLFVGPEPVTEARITGRFGDGQRRFTLPVRVVGRPAGGVAAQRTWADFMDEDASWTAALGTYVTWQGELVGTPGT